jgi:preprotein translocase SecE subunit
MIVINFIKTILGLPGSIIRYIGKIFSEMRQMEWLTAVKVVEYTFTVLLMTVLIAGFIIGSDNALVSMRNFVFTLKI